MQSSLNYPCVHCFVGYCHKCTFPPANIIVLLPSFIGFIAWNVLLGKKVHYNINIRNLISKINQFTIYALKAVVSIFCIIDKTFFSSVRMYA